MTQIKKITDDIDSISKLSNQLHEENSLFPSTSQAIGKQILPKIQPLQTKKYNSGFMDGIFKLKDIANEFHYKSIRYSPKASVESIIEIVSDILQKSNHNLETTLLKKLTDLESFCQRFLSELNYISLKEVTKNADGKLAQLNTHQEKVLGQFDTYKNSMMLEIRSEIKSYEQSIFESFSKNRQELIGTVSLEKEKLIETVSEKENILLELALKRESELSQSISDKQTEVLNSMQRTTSEIVDGIEQDISENLFQAKLKIDDQISSFDIQHKALSELLHVAGGDVLANNNLSQANNEKKSADWLRGIGVTLLTTLILYAAYEINVILSKAEDINLTLMLVRLLFIFLLTMPGVYLLKESSRHRADERKYRRVGIQLATINSYLDSFSEGEKGQIKKELTAKFFNGETVDSDTSTVPDFQKSFEKTLDAVISMAKKPQK